jgi:dTDP-glucose pyrophosphorylase
MENSWKKVLIGPDLPIQQALEIIDQGALRMAMIVDANARLIGVLSDGDIRRALIQRIPLTAPVSEAMYRQPHTLPISASMEEAARLMKSLKLLAIPVVDDEGVVCGVHTINEADKPERRDNWIFLMAGGFGTRLRPLTDDCPKPMLKVGGKPILEGILESFIAAGFHRFYISVHYMADRIKSHFGDGSRWNVTIRYVEESVPLGTAGALSLLPDTHILPLFIMNGDLLTQVNFTELLHFHESHMADLTLCVREYDIKVPYGVVETAGQKVISIIEKPVHHFFVNAGIYVLSPVMLGRLQRNKRVDMPDFARDAINSGYQVLTYPIHEYWLDIGRIEDFERAHAEYFKIF